MDDGKALGDERADGLAVGGIVLAFAGGAAALRDGGKGFDREGEEGVDDDEAEDADADPDEAVIEEDARAGGTAGCSARRGSSSG